MVFAKTRIYARKILWDIEVQPDHPILGTRPDQLLIDKEKIDFLGILLFQWNIE